MRNTYRLPSAILFAISLILGGCQATAPTTQQSQQLVSQLDLAVTVGVDAAIIGSSNKPAEAKRIILAATKLKAAVATLPNGSINLITLADAAITAANTDADTKIVATSLVNLIITTAEANYGVSGGIVPPAQFAAVQAAVESACDTAINTAQPLAG